MTERSLLKRKSDRIATALKNAKTVKSSLSRKEAQEIALAKARCNKVKAGVDKALTKTYYDDPTPSPWNGELFLTADGINAYSPEVYAGSPLFLGTSVAEEKDYWKCGQPSFLTKITPSGVTSVGRSLYTGDRSLPLFPSRLDKDYVERVQIYNALN